MSLMEDTLMYLKKKETEQNHMSEIRPYVRKQVSQHHMGPLAEL